MTTTTEEQEDIEKCKQVLRTLSEDELVKMFVRAGELLIQSQHAEKSLGAHMKLLCAIIHKYHRKEGITLTQANKEAVEGFELYAVHDSDKTITLKIRRSKKTKGGQDGSDTDTTRAEHPE